MRAETEAFKKEYIDSVAETCAKPLDECSTLERYTALAALVNGRCATRRAATAERRRKSGEKTVYYFSMEFLIGRLLENYLMALGLKDAAEAALGELGIDPAALYECERDPGLGNGGLGRLAACYLDSAAALDLSCVGMGIRYRYGLFRQRIRSGVQTEEPDDWLTDGYPWETAKPTEAVRVPFGGRVERRWENGRTVYEHLDYQCVLAVPYDVPVAGFGGRAVNQLRLWSARPVKKQLDLDAFNAGDYSLAQKSNNDASAVTCLLYPDDVTPAGKRLRLQQEYFFVCAGLADITRRFRATGRDWRAFPESVAIHTNDTHPALCVPELLRILMDEEGLDWDTAWDITRRSVSYTNHTVLPEALEKWPAELLRQVLPRLYLIIEEIDRRWREGFDQSQPGWHDRLTATAILSGGEARMANLSVIGAHSCNGVAALHTEILKKTVLRDFYALTPEKFSNKTNGVSHRRFLLQSNPELADLLTERLGPGWVQRPEELRGLLAFRDDTETLRHLGKARQHAKERLCEYIARDFGIDCDPASIFDVQVKRIHAYKRQLLNALKILALCDRLRDDPFAPVPAATFLFAGKAAHSYAFAKEVIRFVCAVADMVNGDPLLSRRMKVVFMENFGVSMGQRIYPAADISEQISTAGKEASGTGCMKFMMSGAITLGTPDGANLEIARLAGEENVTIFGLTAEKCLGYASCGGYSAAETAAADETLSRVLGHLTDGSLGAQFWDIRDALINRNDEYFVLKDFAAYLAAWDALAGEAGNLSFLKKSLSNIAAAGFFSSDRAVREYARDIWNIGQDRPV